jgi:V8-like Glu-specific endopeptidase
MVELTAQERQQLRKILEMVPALDSPAGRRQVLENAGLSRLVQHIDLHGASYIVLGGMISRLAYHGRNERGEETLGLFLNEVKAMTGLENQRVLSELMNRHSMVVPIADAPPLAGWSGGSTPEQVRERIITANTLRPIAFLASGLRVARSVAYIQVNGGKGQPWRGTGFLVTPDLMVTNEHILHDTAELSGTVVRFNYEDDGLGRAQPVREYSPRPDGLFHADPELDFAIVELDGSPGDDWGWLPFEGATVDVGERVNIVQHPGGRAKEIAIQSNFVEYVGGDVVQYITPTEQGSSGSPVFNDAWRVCAVHRRGGPVLEPTTGHYFVRNEGVLVAGVLARLPENIRARVTNL